MEPNNTINITNANANANIDNEPMETDIDCLQQSELIIQKLFEKYKEDPYMTSRAYNYICFQLPNLLDSIKKDHVQRTLRMEELINEQYSFVQSFLVSNQYFYIPATEKFFYYDGIHYIVYTEDDILYHILTSISRDRSLLCWKQKTKLHIMKRIKENTLLKSIPESITIQTILDVLYPSLFESKMEAKYFLCILGDNIFKKNTDLIHFIDAKSKSFIRELNNICQVLLGINLYHTIKHKYYEHDYSQCRLVKINETVRSEHIWSSIINIHALDLLCVACHYSNRYGNSDQYLLDSSHDEALINDVFYLKNTNQEELVNLFINDFLQIKKVSQLEDAVENIIIEALSNNTSISNTAQISWKDMQYLWKQFLDSKKLPNIIFQQPLKNILVQRLTQHYKESYDSFIGISSKQIPFIKRFVSFWEQSIEMVQYESEEYEFKINEISFLFKKWCSQKGEPYKPIHDKQIMDLICYFFPDIKVENEKYIYKIKCNLWNKHEDIQLGLEHFKLNMKEKNATIPAIVDSALPIHMSISMYDAYIFYCKFISGFHKNHEQIVSKSYFEKYLFQYMSNFIIESKYISTDWLHI